MMMLLVLVAGPWAWSGSLFSPVTDDFFFTMFTFILDLDIVGVQVYQVVHLGFLVDILESAGDLGALCCEDIASDKSGSP